MTQRRRSSGRPGFDDVPITIPRRIGEVLRIPGLVGAAVGLGSDGAAAPAIWPAIGALALAAVAFALLATAGLPIITRYAFLIAAIAAVLCGGALLGWRELADRDERWPLGGRRGRAGAVPRLRPAAGAQARPHDRAIAAQQASATTSTRCSRRTRSSR